MLTVRPQDPSLTKEGSSHPLDHNPPITQHSHLISPLYLPTLPILLPMSQGSHFVMVVCSLMTHIGFRCIQCVVYYSSLVILVR